MKKTSLLLFVVLIFALAFTACSSGEPETAEELWEKIDGTMDALDSYEAELTMEMTFFVSGYEVSGKATGTVIESGVNADDYYFYQNVATKVKSDELGLDEKVTVINGYNEGLVFVSTKGSDLEQKLCAPMTKEDFLDYIIDSSFSDLDVDDCTNAEFVKNEDNTWSLTYSGYTKSAVDAIVESFGIDGDMSEMIGADVLDLKIAISAGEDFLVDQMDVEFIFDADEGDEVPVITATATYSEYNNATRVTGHIKPESYNQIEDIRLPETIGELIEARQEAKEGAFTLDLEQTLMVVGNKSAYHEIDNVTFGERDGNYYYDIEAEIEDSSVSITYENGTQTVTQIGQTETVAQTDAEAKEFIDGLINSAKYDAMYVTNITKDEDGVYTLEMAVGDPTPYSQVYTNMGATFTSATQTVTVTIKDDAITEIKSVVDCDGNIYSGNSRYGVGLTVTTTVTFN